MKTLTEKIERLWMIHSPLAKKTALEKGLDIAKISGSGPNSRIILADVEEALKAGPVKQVETKASVAAVAQPV